MPVELRPEAFSHRGAGPQGRGARPIHPIDLAPVAHENSAAHAHVHGTGRVGPYGPGTRVSTIPLPTARHGLFRGHPVLYSPGAPLYTGRPRRAGMGGVPLGYPPDIHEDLTSKPGPRKPQPWERILNRKDRPNIGVGLLTLPDGNQTGFQISPRHVVTAAHGLVEHGDNVVEVDPAGVSYFDPEKGSSIQACRVLVAQEYHDLWNADLPDGRYREWDFSVVTLEEPLNTEFWFGLFAAPDSLLEGYMEDVFIYERGFPECEDECAPPGCDDGMSASMFGSGFSCTAWDEPPSDGETSRFRIVKCPVNHRMSGGPLYIVWNNQAYAVGLHSAITPLPDGADSYCEAWPMFFSSTTLARILAFRRDCGGIGG